MTKKYLLLILLFSSYLMAQETKTYVVQETTKKEDSKKEASSATIEKVPFGEQFSLDTKLPNENYVVVCATLKELDKKYSRKFYSSNDFSQYRDKFKIIPNKSISLKDKSTLIIPPLKPNRFYSIDVNYTKGIYLINVFSAINKEGKYTIQDNKAIRKNWMDLVDKIKIENGFSLYYLPSNEEMDKYVTALTKYDFTGSLSEKENDEIVDLSFKSFEILKFKPPTNDEIIAFAKKVKNKYDSTDNFRNILFIDSSVGGFKINDYPNIYQFYENHIMPMMRNKTFQCGELQDIIEKEILKKSTLIKNDDFIPNFYFYAEHEVTSIDIPISTYTNSFATAYKRSLVPDFGYVSFVNIGTNSSLRGGSPFVGVNISLSPSNKNVPLRLSEYDFAQRFSIHTGVVLESIEEANVRDDFFNDLSLMIGGSYKFLTQGTRINFGGLLYNKIDAISGSKSIAVQPYIGLSIDIEIRKWLSEIIPSLGNNFKIKSE
ncbi:hypothetical protein [Flagellimonas onchidii]|uniref:hypothetical protein n=1 Tax=Flagellimonas onchidii TaxID=2562684 RepID=UPI0010A5B2A3|nr:hypothetical protein [Allomuricauda onchidii]